MSDRGTTTGYARALAVVTVLAAMTGLAVAVWVLLIGPSRVSFLGARIQIGDAMRPLAAAAASAAVLLWIGRRARAVSVVAILLVAACGALMLVVLASRAEPTTPTGDLAVIELYTHLAKDGRLFLGPYSRFGWNHPGPIYFYLLTPFYVLSGYRTAGLAAGALAINLASLTALVWTAFRAGGRRFGLLVACASVLYMIRVSDMLASTWNPHVLALPVMALLVLSAASIGRPSLLPLVALFATFAVQTHVGLAPPVFAIGAAAMAGGVLLAYRDGRDRDFLRTRSSVHATLWLLVALWFLPLAEQVVQPSGNLGKLWGFFVSRGGTEQPFRESFAAWAGMLSGLFRPDFRIPTGGPIRSGYSGFTQTLSAIQLVLVAAATLGAVRSRDRFHAVLGTLLLLAALVGLWSTTRIRDTIVDHSVFWLSAVGALNAAFVLNAALAAYRPAPGFRAPKVWAVACIAIVIAGTTIGIRQLQSVVRTSGRLVREDLIARRLVDASWRLVRAELPRPVVRIDQPTWDVAAGVLLQLLKKDIPFTVDRPLTPMFTSALAATGDETSVLYFANPALHARLLEQPGVVPIAHRDRVFVDAIRDRAPDPSLSDRGGLSDR